MNANILDGVFAFFLITPLVIDETVSVGVPLIGLMRLVEGEIPFQFIEIREESVGMGWRIIDQRQAETVGEGHGLAIDGSSSDDINFLISTARCQRQL